MISAVQHTIRTIFKDWYLLVVLLFGIALTLFKLSYLSIPFTGDELWVYGPGVIKMSNQLPSLLPSSMELTDHWAHPMFFFFSAGIWGNIFGSTIVSVHSFGLLISIVFLIVLYLVSKHFLGDLVAFLVTVIMLVQSIFLGQSTLALPEVMLALFMFLTIYCYHTRKYLAFAIVSGLLVLTKETGVLLIGTLGIWSLIKVFFYDKSGVFTRSNLLHFSVLCLPIMVLFGHMLLLKLNYGWYIMPDRIDHFEFTLENYYRRIRDSFHYVFIDQGRRPLVIGLALALSVLNTHLKWWQRIGLVVVFFALMKVFFNYWKLPLFVPLIIIPILTIIALKKFVWDQYKENPKHELLAISSIFLLVYVLFSSAQFDSLRYLLCSIPFYILLAVYFVQKHVSKFKIPVVVLFSFVAVVFSVVHIFNDKNFGDDTLNYADVCLARKDAIAYLEKENYYTTRIEAPFLYQHAMSRVECGYLGSEKVFTKVVEHNSDSDSSTPTLRIFDNQEGADVYADQLSAEGQELIFEKKKGNYWLKIYKTK